MQEDINFPSMLFWQKQASDEQPVISESRVLLNNLPGWTRILCLFVDLDILPPSGNKI